MTTKTKIFHGNTETVLQEQEVDGFVYYQTPGFAAGQSFWHQTLDGETIDSAFVVDGDENPFLAAIKNSGGEV